MYIPAHLKPRISQAPPAFDLPFRSISKQSSPHGRPSCAVCRFEAYDRARLLNHYREEGCLVVCEGCSGGAGKGWVRDSPEYWEHVSREHVCTECGRHFNSDSNLRHHEITHRRPTIKCLASTCDRKFTTYGGMLIHLEAGTSCASGIDILDLNKSAAMCFQARKWVMREYRDALRSHERFELGVCPFKCPDCGHALPKLSSLFMHAASPSCGVKVNGAVLKKLKRWLWKVCIALLLP
ncbi:hypothetical protein CC80DRAFT_189314 [Byssothecium circinans]|uniref:C2H2-type domain-containing protein n=1 Tax=Byssothecium circinans TaxID=147558 RepID=A0A6A5TGH1_9PLEO|nr:hypothetical protein CC80DRAFT_189314 [Byssothecium circinans]